MDEVLIEAAAAADMDVVKALLRQANLPEAGVDELGARLWVARDGGAPVGALVGCVGLELYGQDALLRSLCVDGARRGGGVGDRLVREALRQAAARRVRGVFLLTTTAAEYFTRHGFRRIGRDALPAAVRTSAEFTSLCPASAVAMGREVTW